MTDLYHTWQTLVDDLTTQRDKLMTDIRHYPSPIPACDAQFNYLLEKRDHITVELYRLQGMQDAITDSALQDFIKNALNTPRFIYGDVERGVSAHCVIY